MSIAVHISTGQLQPGTTIAGKYRLVRRIATGGMGEVHEARHERIGSRVAIKFLRADLIHDARYLARFEQEACVVGALQHENLTLVFDIDAESERPFIVMEFVDGENLASLIEREAPLSVPRAAGLIVQGTQALQIAHRAGVIHRDLKPANLMVSRRANGQDWLRVLDFGIARLVDKPHRDAITVTGAVLGTAHYMSPEQARDSGEVGSQTDVYALGAILYEMLSGQRVHPGKSYNEIIGHLLLEEVTPLETLRPGLPAPLGEIVHKALAKELPDRYQSMAELAMALKPFAPSLGAEINAAESAATTSAPVARGSMAAPRKPLLRFFFSATSTLAAGFLLGQWYPLRPPKPTTSSLEPLPAVTRSSSALNPEPPVAQEQSHLEWPLGSEPSWNTIGSRTPWSSITAEVTTESAPLRLPEAPRSPTGPPAADRSRKPRPVANTDRPSSPSSTHGTLLGEAASAASKIKSSSNPALSVSAAGSANDFKSNPYE